MTALTVTPITAPTITAWLVSTATASDVVTALAAAVELGYQANVKAMNQNGAVTFSITLASSGYPSLTVSNGNWLVSNGTSMSVYTAAQFVATYTADTPMIWAPTSTPPVAAAESGLTATITFPQPTSANGPWTYTATYTDTTANTTGTATISGGPVLNGSDVTITVEGLIEGDDYTFEVTCDTTYDGVTATSVASNSITATT